MNEPEVVAVRRGDLVRRQGRIAATRSRVAARVGSSVAEVARRPFGSAVLKDVGCRTRYIIRDRDTKFPVLFDSVLNDAGIEVVLSGIRMPRMNAIMERRVQSCRRELLDGTLIWN